jgi:hypothetical protein
LVGQGILDLIPCTARYFSLLHNTYIYIYIYVPAFKPSPFYEKVSGIKRPGIENVYSQNAEVKRGGSITLFPSASSWRDACFIESQG